MRLVVALTAVVGLTGGAIAVGYTLGEDEAPNKSEASATEEAAFDDAYEEAHGAAAARSRDKGKAEGEETGQRAGARAGAGAGQAKGDAKAEKELAAQAAAAVPEPPPLIGLPNGELGYALPPEDRSLSCVGIEAATGECVGD